MQNKELLKKVLQYLELSTMAEEEKAMWMSMLPYMEESKLEELKNILEKEVNSITDLYLQALSQNN